MASRSFVIRTLMFTMVLVSLIVLFLSEGLGVLNFNPNPVIKGIIVFSAGVLIAIETIVTRDLEFVNPRSINFILGVPSAIIAMLLGLSFALSFQPFIAAFGGFLGGIYLAAIIILVYEWFTALIGFNVDMG